MFRVIVFIFQKDRTTEKTPIMSFREREREVGDGRRREKGNSKEREREGG